MEKAAFFLSSNIDDAARCESILEDFLKEYFIDGNEDYSRYSLLVYFINRLDNSLFRSIFHVNKETIFQLASEVKQTKTFRTSLLANFKEDNVVAVVALAVLYINSKLSIQACSMISGYDVGVVDNYLNLFIKMMNELKDKVIRFPALNNQGLLRVNSKRFFPGAVGVVGMINIV